MSTVSGITPTTAKTASTTGSGTNISSDYQMFLKLLTTQMQNQDPTDPIDSSDYAVQLATFSGVEQQVKTNELLTSMTTQLGLLGVTQYAGWVGMEARVAAPAYFDGTTPLSIAPNPVTGADQAVLVVKDAAGTEVARRDVGTTAETIDWTGTDSSGNALPAGVYSFELESYNAGTLLSTDPAEVYSTIAEVQGTAGGSVLVLRGGAQVSPADVTGLRDPDQRI
ncbi:flagellar hook capping FlgD N-terminal domain-containing protein [Paenirhodobacter hankyongi]|uniref:Basal-body rod modification protein FlgD n=1 Tax=Paenirhodobacter hankyongi TaxID=2294033 RepID=A0A421BM03_9RHOB|nr:flagellar hook capping FlgD N-terminal domain-containing protein [Sinirhodobacter hankyongi]RLL64070.1 flagellar basal body rod modification protein [Sinirhodobacter hankyongi]